MNNETRALIGKHSLFIDVGNSRIFGNMIKWRIHEPR